MRATRLSLFVDTSSWVAVNNPRDGLHKTARKFYKEKAFGKFHGLVTTNLVMAEAHSYLLKTCGRVPALKFLALVNSGTRINIIYSTPDLEEAALKLLFKYQDQDFSFCDAVSFAVMKEMGVRAAFAFDSHFETAGFRRLP
jgi:predicted nucleic acid-binding protein